MEPWELGLDYVIEAFKSVLGLKEVSPLGSPKRTGVCDSKEKPVQWHTGYWMGLGKFEFGIVLECKKYEYWPIAVFIENELKNSTLLSKLQDIAKSEDGAKIWVGFARNAWQGKARPVIERIGGEGDLIRLPELTDKKWNQMLEEAYACLDPQKNHRGRAEQTIMLRNGEKRKMEVSPSLLIHVQTYVPGTAKEAYMFVRGGFKLLSPFYDIVKEQSQNSSPSPSPSGIRHVSNGSREALPPNVRMFVWRRDQGKCVQCGGNERLEFDHIIPVSKGGSNTERNIQLLCERCNRGKGTQIL
ncbi:MAG: HNH endonuclease [Nitrospirota bacterium]